MASHWSSPSLPSHSRTFAECTRVSQEAHQYTLVSRIKQPIYVTARAVYLDNTGDVL